MFQQRKNTRAMQMTGVGLVFWLFLVYRASTAETGLLRWHAHMHWFDKLFWYTSMAIGPGLAGFLLGVGFGGRKVLARCSDCGGKGDVDTMHWRVNYATDQSGHWRCQRCCERYNRWNE